MSPSILVSLLFISRCSTFEEPAAGSSTVLGLQRPVIVTTTEEALLYKALNGRISVAPKRVSYNKGFITELIGKMMLEKTGYHIVASMASPK